MDSATNSTDTSTTRKPAAYSLIRWRVVLVFSANDAKYQSAKKTTVNLCLMRTDRQWLPSNSAIVAGIGISPLVCIYYMIETAEMSTVR